MTKPNQTHLFCLKAEGMEEKSIYLTDEEFAVVTDIFKRMYANEALATEFELPHVCLNRAMKILREYHD